MVKIIFIFTILLISVQFAISQVMKVHTTSGVDEYNISDIDSITFTIVDTSMIYLINDEFENYTIGSFPASGGWYERYNGSGQNIVDNAHAHSGTKSFRLQGLSSWSATIENHNAGWQSNCTAMGYEIYFFTNGGDHSMGFLDYSPIWGLSYGTIIFAQNGNIVADSAGTGVNIMPYTFGQWYKVKVEVENMYPYKFRVWIDNIYMGEYQSPESSNHSIAESYFHINAGHVGNFGWFDDAKVWYVGGNSNTAP